MRKILIIPLLTVFFVVSPLIVSSLWAATYYVDFTGGADTNDGEATGTPFKYAPGMSNCSDTCDGITPAAGDIIYFKMGEVWRDQLTITWSGDDDGAGYITYARKTDWGSGDNPRILGSELCYAGEAPQWTQLGATSTYSCETGYARTQTGMRPSNEVTGGRQWKYYPGNITWVDPGDDSDYESQDVDINSNGNIDDGSETLPEGFFYSKTSDATVWFTFPSSPYDAEVGARQYGIHINSVDWVKIDGIDIYGPTAETGGWNAATACVKTTSVHGITLQNMNIKYCEGNAIDFDGDDDGGNIIQDVNIYDCKLGIIGDTIGRSCSDVSCTTYGDGITVQRVVAEKISVVGAEHGDRDGIGFARSKYVLVSKSIVKDTGWVGMERHMDASFTFVTGCSDARLEYSYAYDSGQMGVGMSGDTYSGTAPNWEIDHVIVDGFGKHPGSKVADYLSACGGNMYGIKIGGGGAGSDMSDVKIYNATVMGGIYCNDTTLSAGIYTTTQITSNFEMRNVISYDDSAYYNMQLRAASSGAAVTNNDCYRSIGTCVRDRIGGGDSSYTSAQAATWNSENAWAANNVGSDPQLDSNYHITDSSPQAVKDEGYDLAGVYQTGLDEDTTWSPLSVITADWETYVGSSKQGMGAFVYDSEDSFRPTHVGVTITGVDLN